jgi:hypothetical protein
MIYQQTLLDLSNKKEARIAMEIIALSLVPTGSPVSVETKKKRRKK